MKKVNIIILFLSLFSIAACSQEKSPFVSFDDYDKLMDEVKEHRKTRLLELPVFNEMSKENGVIILDARSDSMFTSKHIKGAVHLNFADFTQDRLAAIIPSFDTKILIYCNNNFKDDQDNFPTKMVMPLEMKKGGGGDKGLTLALNIPTYINLYGYGYKNVYELNELISVNDTRVEFEGTSVKK